MSDETGRYTIVFNGEIYNYRELRQQLARLGVLFRSTSDTEVLLQAYALWGPACVSRLRGMFAFVIWDADARCLFAARDSFGIKPLYLRVFGTQVWFSSQVKALVRVGGKLTRSAAAQAGFLMWGFVPEPFTPFEEITAIPAGHCLTWSLDDSLPPRPKAWFDLGAETCQLLRADLRAESGAEAQELLADIMMDTVRAHLTADVPVGVFLSGGLDSGTLASLQVQTATRERAVHSVTLGFREYVGTAADETPYAEALAASLGTQHQTTWVSRTDFVEELPRLFAAMDQPSIDGVNTYLVSMVTRRAGLKVALSGIGGDELLGGYPSFRQVPRLAGIPSGLHRLGVYARRMTQPLATKSPKPKLAGLLEYSGSFERAYLLRRALHMPWELTRFMPPDMVSLATSQLMTLPALRRSHEAVGPAALKVSMLEANWYMRSQLLRDADWASMAHGLELRVPLVDWPLWRTILPLRAAWPEIDKLAMARTPERPLPDALLNRPKAGFAVPVAQWLAESDGQERGGRTPPGLRGWALRVWERWFETVAA